MPKCSICDKLFPSAIEIDGVRRNLQKRKKCLECCPFLSRYRKGKLPVDPNGRTCVECLRVFKHKRMAGTTLELCGTCIVNKYRIGKKEKCVDYKGGECIKCGYKKCMGALDFHHRDESSKRFTISGSAYTRRWSEMTAELDKCDLLCANCHRELHWDNNRTSRAS